MRASFRRLFNGGRGGSLITAVVLLCLLINGGIAEDAPGSVRVSYLGPEGTYTQEAARFFFDGEETLIPRDTVSLAVSDVLSGDSDFAVIPQENTVGGPVANYLDVLISAEGIYVVGEIVIPISQTLMGIPGAVPDDIKTVCSHAQGLAQSAQWRAVHLPEAAAVEMPSTAAAASYVAQRQDRSVAAVAAPGAAELYGLEVLAENVQITDANKTRFYVLAGAPLDGEGLTRAVFIITCGAERIDDVIVAIHGTGLELVALHDRPEGSALGEYHFVIECENVNGVTGEQIAAVSGLQGVRFLGCFNAAEK